MEHSGSGEYLVDQRRQHPIPLSYMKGERETFVMNKQTIQSRQATIMTYISTTSRGKDLHITVGFCTNL